MDSRLRFLHPGISEMWGHGDEAQAGNGKPGASGVSAREANPPCIGEYVKRSERKGSEVRGGAVRKSRYCVSRARTANRHR